MSIRVGIVGISGFGGGEALRLIANHPSFELVYAAGESSAGSRLVDRFPGVPARLAGLVIAMGVVDNLGKGAAGQAVQNANLICGLPETAGLEGAPVWP